VGHEALAGVGQGVAVIHPDPGIVGHKGDLVRLAVVHVERIHPPRAPRRGYSVAAQDDGVVPVQMHRVDLSTVLEIIIRATSPAATTNIGTSG
jgi:hypothetical protein